VTPYYADDWVTIYHGDCRDWMPSVDVVVTDPPYGTAAYATDTKVLDGVMLNSWPNAAVFGWPEKLIRLCIEAGRVPDEWVVWWPSNAELKGRFAEVPVARDTEHIALFGSLLAARGAPVGNTHDYAGTGSNRADHHAAKRCSQEVLGLSA